MDFIIFPDATWSESTIAGSQTVVVSVFATPYWWAHETKGSTQITLAMMSEDGATSPRGETRITCVGILLSILRSLELHMFASMGPISVVSVAQP